MCSWYLQARVGKRERDRESEIEGSVWGKWLLFSAVGKSQLQMVITFCGFKSYFNLVGLVNFLFPEG